MRWMLSGTLSCLLALPLCAAASEPVSAPDSEADTESRQHSPAMEAWLAEARRLRIGYAERLAAGSGTRGLLQALLVDLPEGLDDAATQQRRTRYEEALAALPILDADHAWHAVGQCRRSGVCSDDAVLAALRAADPDNAWTWLEHAAAARARGDGVAEREALRRAADADVDRLMRRAARLILEAFDSMPLPPMTEAVATELGYAVLGREQGPLVAEDYRMVWAMAAYSAYALPGLQTVTRLCRGEAAQAHGPEHRRACLRLATRFAREDRSLVGSWLGHSLAVELASDTPEADALRESYRQLRWQRSQGGRLDQALRERPGEMATYLRDLFTRGERTALQAQLRRLGLPTEAPAGWVADDGA